MAIAFLKSEPNAMQPLQLTPGSAGSDLFSTVTKIIEKGQTFPIACSVNMRIPKGYLDLITGTSSVALKGIFTHVGIIDSDFFGAVKVIVTNIGVGSYKITAGDRIGQITLIKYSKVKWIKSETFKEDVFKWNLSDFSGKHSDFGSTGV